MSKRGYKIEEPKIKNSSDFWYAYDRWHKKHPIKPGETAFMWWPDHEDVYGFGGEIVKVTIDAELPDDMFLVHTTEYYSVMPELAPFEFSFKTKRTTLFTHIKFILEQRCGEYRNFMRRELFRQAELKRKHEESLNNEQENVQTR